MVNTWLDRHPYTLAAALLLVSIAALGIRIALLGQSRVLSERQYRSAIISRFFYFKLAAAPSESKRRIATINRKRAGTLEPPLTEWLAALSYLVAGGERLWGVRLMTSLFWIAGGFCLFNIARRFVCAEAALFSVAYYLFVPIGVAISMSFLPDPMMIMLFLFAILVIVRYDEQPSYSRLTMAGMVSALAILVKPICLFALLAAFAALALHNRVGPKRNVMMTVFIFLAIALFPTVLYYMYGFFFGDMLGGQLRVSVRPALLSTRTYWTGWRSTAVGAVGLAPLVVALLGWPLTRDRPRSLIAGLWIGYLIFGLTFTRHIRFAGHYHLQLIVIIALSLAPVADLIVKRLQQDLHRRATLGVGTAAMLLLAISTITSTRETMASFSPIEPPSVAREIGELVGHSDRIVLLASYYGMPLEYYGELSGWYWPRRTQKIFTGPQWSGTFGSLRSDDRPLTVRDRLNALDFTPEYFIITNFREFERHHNDLKTFLQENCLPLAKTDRYLIYKSCSWS